MLLHELFDCGILDDDKFAAIAGARRLTSASKRSEMRSQHAVVNERMMIRRSFCGARHPIRWAYSSPNTKSARLSRSHIANWTSLRMPMHWRPVS